MIVTVYLTKDLGTGERKQTVLIFKDRAAFTSPEQFKSSIISRFHTADPHVRVEFGPVSETGFAQ